MIKTTGIAKVDKLEVLEANETDHGCSFKCRVKFEVEVENMEHVGFSAHERAAAISLLQASIEESDGGDATKAATYKLGLKRQHPTALYRVNGNACSFVATPHGTPTFKAVQGVASLVFGVEGYLDTAQLCTLASFVRESPVELLAGSVQIDLLEGLGAPS